jgi:ABC-type uncharacterized transport system permease subunit
MSLENKKRKLGGRVEDIDLSGTKTSRYSPVTMIAVAIATWGCLYSTTVGYELPFWGWTERGEQER